MRSVARFTTVTALLAILAYPAVAVEILLPELEGMYEMEPVVEPNFGAPAERTVDFHLPSGSGTDAVAYLLVSGDWTSGETTCDLGGGIYQVYPHLPSLIVELTSADYPGVLIWGELMAMPDGEFNDIPVALSSGIEQLFGSEVHARLMISSLIVGWCSVTLDSYGTLSDVRLVLDGVVSVERETLSAIKQLYN